jgi:hypothetical protein
VTALNSLVGSKDSDLVGVDGVQALSNGNYVVASSFWDDGGTANVGAATWGDGGVGISGAVTAANSLVGNKPSDAVGAGGITALGNGNYVVSSPAWNDGANSDVGAVTWADGSTGTTGQVSAANSLIGSRAGDAVGGGGVAALGDGNYAVDSAMWDNTANTIDAGAVSFGRGGGSVGTINANNSVLGTVASGGPSMVFDFDVPRGRLAVGRPASNLVTLFTPPDGIFADGFE